MLGGERAAVVLQREDGAVGAQIRQRDLRRVPGLGVHHHGHRVGLDLHTVEDFTDGDAPPHVVEAAPLRHAVDVGLNLDLRKLVEFGPRPRDLVFDVSEASKRPRAEIDARRVAVGEHRPLLRQHLARW